MLEGYFQNVSWGCLQCSGYYLLFFLFYDFYDAFINNTNNKFFHGAKE